MTELLLDEFVPSDPPAGAFSSTVAPPSATAAAFSGFHEFEFTGNGAEYFRIWVVNLLLTVATLGIYSAWAKVRRLEYFWRNTRFDGAIFDYHGEPKAILKGRLLAFGLFAAYKLAFDISALLAVGIGVLLVVILPWLLARSFRFRLASTSYRGVRFHFSGTVAEAYRSLILLPVILLLTGLFVWSVFVSYHSHPSIPVMLLVTVLPALAIFSVIPMAHFLLKRYQHDHAYFGQSPFFFQGQPKAFFKVYGKAIGLLVFGMFAAGLFGGLTFRLSSALASSSFGWLFNFLFATLSGYILFLFVRPYLESRIQNLVWNKTELGDYRFVSTARARSLLWIHASNLLLIICTTGLYKPFAAIRLVRYRLACLSLEGGQTLDEVLTNRTPDSSGAAGQEAADFFDIEIAL